MGRHSNDHHDRDLDDNILGQPIPLRPIDHAWQQLAALPSVVPVCERLDTVEEVRAALEDYRRQVAAAYAVIHKQDAGARLPGVASRRKAKSKLPQLPPEAQLRLDVCEAWWKRPRDCEPLRWQGIVAKQFNVSADSVRTYWKHIGQEVTDAYSAAIKENSRYHSER